MPKRIRLTRRFPVAMTEDGYRRLRSFAAEAGLDEGEALSMLASIEPRDHATAAIWTRLRRGAAQAGGVSSNA